MSTGRPTQRMDHNLRQSVGAGVSSVFGGKGRTYYVLRHLSSTGLHQAGKEQEIIIDYIELGRDPKCQIRFDEAQRTVSRRHCAIVREGNNWVIRNLSDKNPTLINGRPVHKQWFLNSGDQIQLSMEGPKLGFILPANPSVASIPLTRRLNLFREQALRPYKQALIVLSVLFVLTIAGLSFWLYRVNQQNKDLDTKLQATVAESVVIKGDVDSLQQLQKITAEESQRLRTDLGRLRGNAARQNRVMEERFRKMQDTLRRQSSSEVVVSTLKQYYPEVYLIKANKLSVTVDGETETLDEYSMLGTGFMLSDGSFVTARHIVEPWFFFDLDDPDPLEVLLNIIANKGGTVKVDYTAYSSSGKEINFSSTNFRVDRRNDEKRAWTNPENGESTFISHANWDDGNDWAVWRRGGSSDIVADYELSTTLPSGAALHVLGFPLGITGKNVEPIPSDCKTAMAGLKKGIILVNGGGIESGNSGGPVFYYSNNRYTVVGIVSVRAGSLGYLVPIANIR